jgi:hypothetical protein
MAGPEFLADGGRRQRLTSYETLLLGPLFLITPGGAVRRVTLMSPEKEAVLSSAKIADGRMVAEYYIPGPSGVRRWHFLTVTDLSTGQRLDTLRYQDSESTGVGLGLL